MNSNEEETFKALRGYTFPEIVDFVDDYCENVLKIRGDESFRHSHIIDPIIKKFGWTMGEILIEAIKRRSDVDERYG